MFTLIYSKEALKFLKKLDQHQKMRIIGGLERCRVRPHRFVKKLISTEFFRLRIGDYRAILDIQSDKVIIMVIDIDHRKNIYKK